MPSKSLSKIATSEVQSRVLSLFRDHGPMDDYKLIDLYRWTFDHLVAESTPRTRRRELADMNILKDTKLRNYSGSGRELTVWGLA